MRWKVLCAVLALLMVPGAMAQENLTEVPVGRDAGITPDSLLYFFDRLMEKLELALALDQEKKIKVRLKHAEERLAEIREMQEKRKPEFIVELSNEYLREIEEVEREIEQAERKGGNVTEVKVEFVNTTARHVETLKRVYQLVPPEARPAVEQALNVSMQGLREIEIEMEEGEVEVEISGEGFEMEIRSRIPEEERAKAGKQDGEGESRIEAEVEGNATKVEVELPGVEYELRLNATTRGDIVAEVANRTGLAPEDVERLLQMVEEELPEPVERETEVEEEREERVEIEIEEEEIETEVEIETGGAREGGTPPGGERGWSGR